MVQEVLKHIFNTILFLILTRNTQKLRWEHNRSEYID